MRVRDKNTKKKKKQTNIKKTIEKRTTTKKTIDARR